MRRLARLFTIRTRTEAWLIIYAIAAGAVERGGHYLQLYPGTMGWIMALACTGVVFLAGAKLLDSVTVQPAAAKAGPYPATMRRHVTTRRNRPTASLTRRGLGRPLKLRRD